MLKAKIVSALCSLAVVAAAFAAAAYLPAGQAVMAPAPQSTSKAQTQYSMKMYDGKVGIFENGSSTPSQLLDIDIAALPAEEQRRLEAGITVTSHDELLSLIEDYTS